MISEGVASAGCTQRLDVTSACLNHLNTNLIEAVVNQNVYQAPRKPADDFLLFMKCFLNIRDFFLNFLENTRFTRFKKTLITE